MARRQARGGRRSRRAPLRKFVWARWQGSMNASGGAQAGGANPGAIRPLSQFEQEYGANLIGATVTRMRGVIYPDQRGAGSAIHGVLSAAVEAREELFHLDGTVIGPDEVSDSGPLLSPHKDWFMYFPYFSPSTQSQMVSANATGSAMAFDVRSNRKVEELGQTLHMYIDEFHLGEDGGQAQRDGLTWINMSIGVKLP